MSFSLIDLNLTGSCTLAIAFLRDVGPSWEGMPPGPYPAYAVTSYNVLFGIAVELYGTCVHLERRVGWSAPGKFILG